MLNGTLSSIVDRHNAAAAARRKNSTDPKDADTYEEMMRRLSALTDKRVAEKTKKEHEAFVQLTKEKAAAGDVEAGGQIGRLMVEGALMKRDTKHGLELMSIAAEKGNTFIGRYLATFLMEGQYNVPVDFPKAHYWNMKFAEKGVGDLAYEACMDFVLGRGVGRDLKEAVRLCKVSFDNESYDGAEMLGDLLNGDMPGVPADYALAEAGYRRAMENHWKKNAPDKLTKLLLHSKDGGPDYAKLLPIYQQMADKGDRMAQASLGYLYMNGNGTPGDMAKAIQWLSTAAGGGSERATFDLGTLWITGNNLPKDPAKGLSLYRAAAVKGWPPALYAMGIRTLNGQDVPKDPAEGTRLLELAAGKGDPNAPCALGQIYLQKDPVAARKWFGMGAERGNEVCVQALKNL